MITVQAVISNRSFKRVLTSIGSLAALAGVLAAPAALAQSAPQGQIVIPDDVKTLARPALRHRVILSPAAEIEGRSTDETLATIIDQTPAPR